MIKIKRLAKSFTYAGRGFLKTAGEEQNLKIHLALALAVFALALYFRLSRFELIFLIIAAGLVILMEIANSAVERMTDMLKPRLNSYVKEIKDIAAAAVLVSSLIAVAVGILVFWPHVAGLVVLYSN